MQRKLFEIVNVDFDATGQLLIIYCAFVKYLRKNGNNMMHQLFIDFKNLLCSSLLSQNIQIKIYKTIILPVVLYGSGTWFSY